VQHQPPIAQINCAPTKIVPWSKQDGGILNYDIVAGNIHAAPAAGIGRRAY